MVKQDFIPFGVQYYRAPTPLYGQWEPDMQKMKDIGFNTIKIWAQWRWNNPRENEYDFSDIDRLMDLAYQKGIFVIINTIFDVAPAWFFKKYPESVMITSDGRRLEPQTVSSRQIGGAPGPCHHHGKGIYYRKLFLRELVKRYKDHPALYLWDLWNEPELACGFGRELAQEDLVCYCRDSVRNFIEWLKQKYVSIEELNRKWNRNYSVWDEMEPPRNSHVFNDMIDWRTFFAETLIAETKMRVSAVKEYDSIHPVMVHTVPIPYFDAINSCSYDFGLAKACDMFGNSVGSHPFAAALCTSCAPGKKVINSEIHALGGDTYSRPCIPSFDDIKKHIMIPLSRGIKGFIFWQYRPETLGLESPAWGLTSLDGGETEWLKYCVRVNNALQKYAGVIAEARPLPAKVAVVNSHSSQIFDWCVTHTIDKHYYSVFGAFMAMYHNNFNVDIISTDQVTSENLDNYKVIYYPFPYYMEDKVANELRDWVFKGGTLISEAFFGGIKGSDGLHSTSMPGFGFDEVFGVKEGIVVTASVFMNAYGGEWSKEDIDGSKLSIEINKDLQFISAGETISGHFFCEELIPCHGEVLARFKDGKAAVTRAGYGRGQGIMIGSLPGYIYGKYSSNETGRFISSLLVSGGATPYVEVDKSGVRVDLLKNSKDEYIIVVVSYTDVECEVEIRINEYLHNVQKMKNIITDEEIYLEIYGQQAKCNMILKPSACETYFLE